MSEIYTYQTIDQPVSAIFKEKGSKFFGFAYPIKNEEDIKSYLEELREIHPKATHHCYAWRLGFDKNNYRANDDGEPAGTAGKPILGQIDSLNITNCLVVSIRYFGGTKLGVSGLITSYKTSAKETLEQAKIIQMQFYELFEISCNYESLHRAYQWIQAYNGIISNQDLQEVCLLRVEVPSKNTSQILDRLDSYYPIHIKQLKP